MNHLKVAAQVYTDCAKQEIQKTRREIHAISTCNSLGRTVVIIGSILIKPVLCAVALMVHIVVGSLLSMVTLALSQVTKVGHQEELGKVMQLHFKHGFVYYPTAIFTYPFAVLLALGDGTIALFKHFKGSKSEISPLVDTKEIA